MSNETQPQPEALADAELDAFAQWPEHATKKHVALMVAELQRLRSAKRRDSHSANQIRKLRWTAENILRKIESIGAAHGVKPELVELLPVSEHPGETLGGEEA